MTRANLVTAVLGLALAGCSGIPSVSDYTPIEGPHFGTDGATFRPVSAMAEARCGTLDCHGQISRPMRIFGQQGLRMVVPKPMDGDTTSGTLGTTNDELLANYAAMVGLEPEIAEEVYDGKRPASDLTLVRKPRLTEKHKGGKLWSEGDSGDACLVKWLTSRHAVDTSDCVAEIMHP